MAPQSLPPPPKPHPVVKVRSLPLLPSFTSTFVSLYLLNFLSNNDGVVLTNVLLALSLVVKRAVVLVRVAMHGAVHLVTATPET